MESQIFLPVLFSLLTISALGIVLYVYLRQEQNKIISKDKYDEAWVELSKKTHTTSHSILSISTPRNRALIFLFIFLGAYALIPFFFIVFPFIMGAFDESIKSSFSVLLFLILIPIFLPFFPMGLIEFIMPKFTNDGSFLIFGWVLYIVVCLFGVFAKNRRVSTFTYLVFIALLIMNITGCIRIIEDYQF